MLRNNYLQAILEGFETSKVVAILGPRQCGKTTLARDYFHKHHGPLENYFDLEDPNELWLRGGFPLAYLAQSDATSTRWRKDYIRTFLEQDIPNLGINIPAENLRRFWMMLAHYHGQTFNASEMGGSLGFSHHTMKNYLDILTGTFMVRQLMPWHETINKRQVKAQKIYFRDSGLYHTLLNINDRSELITHPKLGASWKGFALECVIRHLQVDKESCYFWAVHNQVEVDLLIVQGFERIAFEFKYTQSPTLTKSMQTAFDILGIKEMKVIYPGEKRYLISKQIECVGLEQFLSDRV